MKKIAVVTATRAEYGLLSPVIRELRKQESHEFIVHLIVTGTHLSQQYGMTVEEYKEAARLPEESEQALTEAKWALRNRTAQFQRLLIQNT